MMDERMPTSVRAAKALLRTLEATKKAALSDEAAQRARYEAAMRRVPKSEPLFLVRTSGEVVRCTTNELDCYELRPWTKDEAAIKAGEKALRAGELKLSIAGGSSAVSRLYKRLRFPTPEDTRTLRRLDARIAQLTEERRALIAAQGDRGRVPAMDEVVDHVLRSTRAVRAATKLEPRQWGKVSDETERSLSSARTHLGWLEKGKQGDCPCSRCSADRQHAIWKREADARDKARAKEAKAHARHKRFRGDCQLCVQVAHADDATRYMAVKGEQYQRMVVTVSTHSKPRDDCERCQKLLRERYLFAGTKKPEPPSPEELADLSQQEAEWATGEDIDPESEGEVEADAIEDDDEEVA